ncbi:trehalose-6-phosphate synthase, partial [Microbacterium trichothecenolyticum]
MTEPAAPAAELVVVANRLPVDRVVDAVEGPGWRRSPGGLVTALEPVMRRADGAWVGWPGQPDIEVEPFEFEGTHLVPVALSAEEVELYYEGMSNDTFWPLYHDVIAAPRYRRLWWDAYVKVNRRFADAAAGVGRPGGGGGGGGRKREGGPPIEPRGPTPHAQREL